MGKIGKTVKKVTKPVLGTVGDVAEAVGLKAKTPNVTIAQDPSDIAAQTLSANLAADLTNDNTPTIQTGGSLTSASSTLARRNRGTGVSSGLGIGV